MNIVNRLTLRHLRENKKRAIVTVMGIIISVAMITAVAISTCSFSNVMVQSIKNLEGEWIGRYMNVPYSSLNEVEKNTDFSDRYIAADWGNAYIAKINGTETGKKDGTSRKKSNDKGGNFLSIRSVGEKYYKNVPVTFLEGKAAEKDNEIVLNKRYLKNQKLSVKVGDRVTLMMGTRTVMGETIAQYMAEVDEEYFVPGQSKEYVVSGIADSMGNGDYSAYVYLDETLVGDSDIVDIYVMTDHLKYSLYDSVKDTAKAINCENYGTHADLLRYSGFIDDPGMFMTLYGVIGILLIVIMVASVTLIYNAFAISVNERSKYLGMLSSVGATRKQKRASVYYEGAILGAIGIPLGILAGYAGIAVTFAAINPMLADFLNPSGDMTLKAIMPFGAILIIALISVITILISAYIPGKKASKTTAIDAIRQTGDVKIQAKQVRTSKLTRKLFRFEGELALKNLKRNPKKFRIITVSLAISVILFITVNAFTSMLQASNSRIYQENTPDLSVTADVAALETLGDQIDGYTNIESYSSYMRSSNELQVDKNQIDETFSSYRYNSASGTISAAIIGLGDEEFKEYCKNAGLDSSVYMDASHPKAVVENSLNHIYYDEKNSFHADQISIFKETPKLLTFIDFDYDTNTVTDSRQLEVADVIQKDIMSQKIGLSNTLTVVVAKDTFMKAADAEKATVNFDIKCENADDVEDQIRTFVESNNLETVQIYNIQQEARANESVVTIMRVFIYGFIALITMISIANIFNTISTGVQLRRREFAMLKSMGMTQKSFLKMISFESVFYGIRSLLFSLPISLAINYLLYKVMGNNFGMPLNTAFSWQAYLGVVVMIFLIVGTTLLYSVGKVKNDNIIETLKNEDN